MPLRLLIAITTCVLLTHANPQDDTETFITKEAAKELRTKLSSSIEQQDDYDEILKDIIRGLGVKPKSSQQQIIYEKRYFDYLPNEIMDTDDVASEDLTHESVNPENSRGSSGFESSENNKREKRDTPVRDKRHYQIYHQPLRHYSPFPQVSFYIPYELFSDHSNPFPAFEPRIFNSWNQPNYNVNPQYNPGNPYQNPGHFHSPGNFYLPPPSPPQPPQFYLPSSADQPANIPYPPDNVPNALDNRVSGFEGPDQKVIVDYYPIKPINKNQIYGSNGGGGNSINTYSNKKPYQLTTTQSSFNFDIDSFGKDSQELEIEYAPEIQEEVSTTTRAPIQKPTRRNRNKSQQQNSRQRKSDSESSTTERTNISQQDLAAAGNNGKPNKPLSACVEAIVNCCSRYDEIVRLPCFEAHNCNGAFFGRSPCSRALQQAAFKEVEKYSEAKR